MKSQTLENFGERHMRHLEMLQAVINRHNANSFQIKAMSLTLLTAILAVYATTKVSLVLLIAIPVLCISYVVDTNYLTNERRYIGMYNQIVKDGYGNGISLFEMNIGKFRDKDKFGKVLFSWSLILFYPPLIALIVALYFLDISGYVNFIETPNPSISDKT